jgi:PIN domain nuclease of toxin-antitoxin system
MGCGLMIVLDTHVLVWWAAGERAELSRKAKKAIDDAFSAGQILISSISVWEIAALVNKKRIALSMDVTDWIKIVAEIPSVKFIPVDNDIAVQAVTLPGEFHKDPADRFIVTTARRFSAALVTRDEKIRSYSHVKSIW